MLSVALFLGLMSALVFIMGVRLTEYPFVVKGSVTESAANTFTQATVEMPIAPVVRGVGSGKEAKLQAIEVMKVRVVSDQPQHEDDQANTVDVIFTSDSRSAPSGLANETTFDQFKIANQNLFTTSGAAAIHENHDREHDLTDADGNGRLWTRSQFFAGIKGTGNSSARACEFEWVCHLVEITASEVIVNQALEDA